MCSPKKSLSFTGEACNRKYYSTKLVDDGFSGRRKMMDYAHMYARSCCAFAFLPRISHELMAGAK